VRCDRSIPGRTGLIASRSATKGRAAVFCVTGGIQVGPIAIALAAAFGFHSFWPFRSPTISCATPARLTVAILPGTDFRAQGTVWHQTPRQSSYRPARCLRQGVLTNHASPKMALSMWRCVVFFFHQSSPGAGSVPEALLLRRCQSYRLVVKASVIFHRKPDRTRLAKRKRFAECRNCCSNGSPAWPPFGPCRAPLTPRICVICRSEAEAAGQVLTLLMVLPTRQHTSPRIEAFTWARRRFRYFVFVCGRSPRGRAHYDLCSGVFMGDRLHE